MTSAEAEYDWRGRVFLGCPDTKQGEAELWRCGKSDCPCNAEKCPRINELKKKPKQEVSSK